MNPLLGALVILVVVSCAALWFGYCRDHHGDDQ